MAVLLSSLLCGLLAPAAIARVPQGFAGMVVGPPVFPDPAGSTTLKSQLDLMVSSGVESLRVSVEWQWMQPYRSWSQVPAAQRRQFQSDGVDHVPTNFSVLDTLVREAARRGLTVLPAIVNAPRWDGNPLKYGVFYIPTSNAPYGNFLKALVRRYGSRGTFWHKGSSKVPITTWQVWNEPNEYSYWPRQPFYRSYVSLLRVASAAIKKADPHAKVALAGLSNYSWKYLAKIYQIKGARQLFDVVGIHAYTSEPRGVVTIIGNARQVMRHYGDTRKLITADEMGWPSSVGQGTHLYGFESTEVGQAENISKVLPLLAQARQRLGILGFYYYTWVGVEHPGAYTFDFSGLLRFTSGDFVKKPAFDAFSAAALALEGCRTKATVATRCAGRS